MKNELMQLSSEIVSSIILNNDLSVLSKEQRVQYVGYRCQKAGLDVAGSPFNLIPNKEGKLFLYANKEAAAQLNQLRSLSPVVSKEEFLMDNTIYKVTYKVTENGRATEDCGAVGLVKIKKMNGQPDEIRKLSPDEVADAIMKAHTKAKRRAILTHCGIGTNDLDDTPAIVAESPKEEIKHTEAIVKDVPKEIPEAKKKAPTKGISLEVPIVIPVKEQGIWRGKITKVLAEELPGGRPCWSVVTDTGEEFRTADPAFEEALDGINQAGIYEIGFKLNSKGTAVITKMGDAK